MTVGLREGDKLAAVAVRHGYGSEYQLAQAALAYCEGTLYAAGYAGYGLAGIIRVLPNYAARFGIQLPYGYGRLCIRIRAPAAMEGQP